MRQTTCSFGIYSVLFTCTHQRSPPIALLMSYQLDIANFAYPLSFNALFRRTPFEFMEKLYDS